MKSGMISVLAGIIATPMAVSVECERAVEFSALSHAGMAGGLPSAWSGLRLGAPSQIMAGNSGAQRVGAHGKPLPGFESLYTRVPAGEHPPGTGGVPGSVAVIDVYGVLMAHDSEVYDEDYGRFGTSYSFIRAAMHTALADPEVKAVLVRYDSPGGAAIGMHPLSAELFDLAHGDGGKSSAGSGFKAGGKPIVSYADRLMASAAIGLGVQASYLLVSPAAITGSIGTMASFVNISRMLSNFGVSVETIKDPPHKDAGSPYRPMSDDDRARLQGTVSTLSAMFRADVARGRRVSAEKVGEWVQTMTFVGDQAVKAGLADGRVNSLEQAVAFAAKVADVKRRH